MSALDKVLALSRGEAEMSTDLVELTWSKEARIASAKSRALKGHSIGGDRHLYTLPSGHQIHVRSSDGRVMGGEYKRNAEGKDALDAHPDMFEKKFVGKSIAHDDHNIFKPHLAGGIEDDSPRPIRDLQGKNLPKGESPGSAKTRADTEDHARAARIEAQWPKQPASKKAGKTKEPDLPGPDKEAGIKAGTRSAEPYKPNQLGGGHTPQTHPHEFDSSEIHTEVKNLDRIAKRYGNHPLLAGARNKLTQHLAERAGK